MSIMGKLNERTVMIKKYHETAPEHESCQLFSYELNTIRLVINSYMSLIDCLTQCKVFEKAYIF